VAIDGGRVVSDGMDGYYQNEKINFGYFVHEGVHNIFLHGFMSFAAVGIIVLVS
jgi:hypothetical protein